MTQSILPESDADLIAPCMWSGLEQQRDFSVTFYQSYCEDFALICLQVR